MYGHDYFNFYVPEVSDRSSEGEESAFAAKLLKEEDKASVVPTENDFSFIGESERPLDAPLKYGAYKGKRYSEARRIDPEYETRLRAQYKRTSPEKTPKYIQDFLESCGKKYYHHPHHQHQAHAHECEHRDCRRNKIPAAPKDALDSARLEQMLLLPSTHVWSVDMEKV